jgi:hypothetical protein
MIHLPKNVKCDIGTVCNPATQVAEVEVKKMSTRGISTSRACGRERRRVPAMITNVNEASNTLPGEKWTSFGLPIFYMYLYGRVL